MSDSPISTRVRSAGIWVVGGWVLMESMVDRELWGVPGGRVEDGESLAAACQREYLEELEVEVVCERLALVADCFFRMADGTLSHDLAFYFTVSAPGAPITQSEMVSREPALKFEWLPMRELGRYDLVPEHLLTLLPRAMESWHPLYATYDVRKGHDMLTGTTVQPNETTRGSSALTARWCPSGKHGSNDGWRCRWIWIRAPGTHSMSEVHVRVVPANAIPRRQG